MDDRSIEMLWRMYGEHMAWCRHMDSQRGVTNSALFAISSAVVGLITLDGKVNQSDQALGWFVVAIGIFGIAFYAEALRAIPYSPQTCQRIPPGSV